jgi:hypothetical protein
MAARARRAYLFGDFELRVTTRVLTRNGNPIQLGSKSFEVLTCLVIRAGEVVTKDELLKAAWPDAFVEEGNLTSADLGAACGPLSAQIAENQAGIDRALALALGTRSAGVHCG